MLAAAQLQRIGAGRPASRRTPRPANRLPRPKTAPGVFWRHSPQTRPMRSTQAAESHQEKWVFRYELAPGCAVAPNSAGATTSIPVAGAFTLTADNVDNIIDAIGLGGDALKTAAGESVLGTAGEVLSNGATLFSLGNTAVQTGLGNMSYTEATVNVVETAAVAATPPPGDLALGTALFVAKVAPVVAAQAVQEATNNLPVNPPEMSPGVDMGGGIYWQEEWPY